MGEVPDDETEGGSTGDLPRDLRFLKTLVTVLTVVMIAGVITITALLVIRLNGASGEGQIVVRLDPGLFQLPDGVEAIGFSVVGNRTVIVGDDGVIRVFDSETGFEIEAFRLEP